MHFMPNNNLEENISHFILIAPTKKNCLQKLHFKFLELKNCIWGTRFQVPESFAALPGTIITNFAKKNCDEGRIFWYLGAGQLTTNLFFFC